MQIYIRNLSFFYNFLDLSVVSGATYASKGDLYSCIIVSFFVFPTFSFLWLCFVYVRNSFFALIRSCAVICQVLQHLVLCCLFFYFFEILLSTVRTFNLKAHGLKFKPVDIGVLYSTVSMLATLI